jgi:hypothetical protein
MKRKRSYTAACAVVASGVLNKKAGHVKRSRPASLLVSVDDQVSPPPAGQCCSTFCLSPSQQRIAASHAAAIEQSEHDTLHVPEQT